MIRVPGTRAVCGIPSGPVMPSCLTRRRWLGQAIGLSVCATSGPWVWAQTDDVARARQAAARGRKFLLERIDPELDLLPEFEGASVYWLFHDNYLAAKVLEPAEPVAARRIAEALARYKVSSSGKIEILFGEAVQPLPFRHPRLIEIQRVGRKIIKTEILTDEPLQGWEEYSDLLLMAAMALAPSRKSEAKQFWERALAQWDGRGFRDRVVAKTGIYATYKLALAMLAAPKIQQWPDLLSAIVDRLLAQQAESGGWVTDYDEVLKPRGMANVETTSLAILALAQLQGPAQ